MGLPPRVFWTLHEVAARWGCMQADIAAWAVAGKIEISAAIPPVRCGDEIVSGLVTVGAACIMPMFRRHGPAPTSCLVKRIHRHDDEDWLFITDPLGGVEVHIGDLVVTTQELARFEEEHEIFKRSLGGAGPSLKYDWDGMYLQVIVRIHEQGLPETQTEFVGEMQEWFSRRSETGDAPDERTIRRRLNPIWRALREAS